MLDVAGHLQKTAPIGGVLISEATRAALGEEPAGFEPGAPLARENLAHLGARPGGWKPA